MKTTVRLLSHSTFPLETIFACWEASRHNQAVLNPETLFHEATQDRKLKQQIRQTFLDVINSAIPVAENVSFTFLLEGVSVALREQMVRHRVGMHFGDRIGVDIVPDVADSTWWAQSMRILDMGRFATREAYDIPDSVRNCKGELKGMPRANCEECKGKGVVVNGIGIECDCGCREKTVEEFYCEQMGWIQSAYNRLVKAGVPMEDARNLIPLGAQSRITWTINLSALQHVVGKRGCWILQLGVWEPVIRGMVEELATKIDPVFRKLISPPCVKNDQYIGCKFHLDNSRRILGEDEIPPCRLFCSQETDAAVKMTDVPGAVYCPVTVNGKVRIVRRTDEDNNYSEAAKRAAARSERMREDYRRLWGFDPDSGPATADLPDLFAAVQTPAPDGAKESSAGA